MKYISIIALVCALSACTASEAKPEAEKSDTAKTEIMSDHGHDHSSVIVRNGEGAAVPNPFHPISLLLSHKESEGEVTIYQFDLPPNSAGSPPHTHSLEDEYFYVVSGSLDVMVGSEVMRLNAGDFASLTRGQTHMFWNGSDGDTRLIMTTTGSAFENFMASVAPRLAEAKPADMMEAGAVIGKLAGEHGIKTEMEKMPEEAAPYYTP